MTGNPSAHSALPGLPGGLPHLDFSAALRRTQGIEDAAPPIRISILRRPVIAAPEYAEELALAVAASRGTSQPVLGLFTNYRITAQEAIAADAICRAMIQQTDEPPARSIAADALPAPSRHLRVIPVHHVQAPAVRQHLALSAMAISHLGTQNPGGMECALLREAAAGGHWSALILPQATIHWCAGIAGEMLAARTAVDLARVVANRLFITIPRVGEASQPLSDQLLLADLRAAVPQVLGWELNHVAGMVLSRLTRPRGAGASATAPRAADRLPPHYHMPRLHFALAEG